MRWITRLLLYSSILQSSFGFQSSAISIRNEITLLLHSISSNIIDDEDDGKARVLFLGTPDVAAISLKTIYEQSQCPNSAYKIVGVVTKRRLCKRKPSPVKLVAEELELPYILHPEKASDIEFLDELENIVKPDLCITAAYGEYLPTRFLQLPKFGTLNIHPSLLPRWRGASPVQRSLEAGDNPIGVSVLYTTSKMDSGPLISQKVLTINEKDQATTIRPRLYDIGTQLLLDTLPKVISGEITMDNTLVQDESQAVEASKINTAEGQLHPENMSAIECHNRIRGFSIWPGTYIYVQIGDDDETKEPVKVKIIESNVLDETVDPTNVIEIGPKKKDGLRLVHSDGSVLELLKVQPVTRNGHTMDAQNFVNGLQGQSVRWINLKQKHRKT